MEENTNMALESQNDLLFGYQEEIFADEQISSNGTYSLIKGDAVSSNGTSSLVTDEVASNEVQETLNEAPVSEATVPATSNNIINKEEDLPSLIGSSYPPSYITIVERILEQYKLLPQLCYADLYIELGDLSIHSSPTPTLQILNDELQKVQSAKDRLAEIYISVIQCHNFKKRAVDILQSSWGKFSDEKNSDSRKGDATFRLSLFLIDFANSESLLKTCNHILKNLDSLHDSLSRRITIYQLTIKLQDLGRSNLPDYDFDRKPASAFVEEVTNEPVKELQDDGTLSEDNF